MRSILTSLALLAPLPALAHPHVFIDTGVEVIFDDEGRLTHVRVTWAYDDFYSLLLAEDYGIDQDGDGALTPEEEAKITGFDANWVEGYYGDLVAKLEGQALTLSGPLEPTAKMVEGRLISTHLREVSGTPVIGGDTLSIKAFDESFYTAYELNLPVKLTGAPNCQMDRVDADIDGELAQMQAFLLTLDANANLEENDIPLMGERFATDLRITCPAS